MIYAPVIIPTLNRYEHLRMCLESLSHCTGADQTEVYVALDYPPSEKYVDGWKKNKEYLENCGDLGFKELHKIYRNHNYGIWTNATGEKTNCRALIEEYILGKYDCYILSEDDNIFAPCFLEYMNKGFQLFRGNPQVSSLCGFRHYYPIKFQGSSYFLQSVDYCAWGVGLWCSRAFPITDYHWYRSHLSLKNIFKVLINNGSGKLITFLDACSNKWNGRAVDQHVSVEMTLTGTYQVMPTVSLVRNIGIDDSGASFCGIDSSIKEKFDNAPLSSEEHFDFIGSGKEFLVENQRIYRDGNFNKQPLPMFLKRLVKKIIKIILYP